MKIKNVRTNLIYSSLTGLSLVALLSGCGRDKADAMKDYKGLTLVSAEQKQNSSVNYGGVNAFRISCLNCEQKHDLAYFSDDEVGEIKLKVESVNNLGISKLRMSLGTEIPGATLTPSTIKGDVGVWIFKWKPNHVLNGNVIPQAFDLILEAYGQATVGGQQMITPVTKVIAIYVGQSGTRPSIQDNTVPTTASEGETIPFTITVFDGSLRSKGTAPTLNILSYQGGKNSENPCYNYKEYADIGLNPDSKIQNPAPLNGAFVYSYLMISKAGVKLPKRNDLYSSNANLCFSATTSSSVTQNTSIDAKNFRIEMLFKVRPPLLKWNDIPSNSTSIDLTAGIPQTIKFEVTDKEKIGTVSAETNATLKWPSVNGGAPALKCEGSESFHQICTFTWTPSCSVSEAKPLTKKLIVTVSNVSGGHKKNGSEDYITLNVNKKDLACDQTVSATAVQAVPMQTAPEVAAAADSASAPVSASKAQTKTIKKHNSGSGKGRAKQAAAAGASTDSSGKSGN